MLSFVHFLGNNPFVLLFFVIGLAIWIGNVTVKGYGLGMVAAAIIIGSGIAIIGSLYGVKFHLDEFTKSLFYYLFMYGVGLRVGPSFINSIKGDGLKFVALAIVSSCIGLSIVVIGTILLDLPLGAAGGILAGSQTMSAAIGSASQAVSQGAVPLPQGMTQENVDAMIALSYGITYVWGTVGIVLICKYLPRWWGLDAKKAAKEYEVAHGVPNVDESGLTGYRPFDVRAYVIENEQIIGRSIEQFRQQFPMYHIINILRDKVLMGADSKLILQKNDVVAVGARLSDLTANMGLLGQEIADPAALNIALDLAEILVTHKAILGKALKEFNQSEIAGQIQLTRIERAGVPIPIGLETKLQYLDVLYIAGLKTAVNKAALVFGRIARHNTSTDLLTLSAGMILGFLIGLVEFPIAGSKVGLGNAGGLLVSGIFISSAYSRLRFFGNTPNAARNILEDMGLIVFVAIVGINAGGSLLEQLTGILALKIFMLGFVACCIPPFIVWAIGYHFMKINPAVLMGGVAGARAHSGPAREAAKEIDSSVPWIGFPVAYAISSILLTVFGYVAMVLAQ